MEHPVGEADAFADGRRQILTIGDLSIGVMRHQGTYYAFRNRCPHQGGPVCEGVLIGRVTEQVDELGRTHSAAFSEEDQHLVCPWHGMEFNVRTGVSWSDPNRRLEAYEVVERDGVVHVVV